jgi:hypothetical protein
MDRRVHRFHALAPHRKGYAMSNVTGGISPSTTQPRPMRRLAALDREIERTRRMLHELWRRAAPADRVFACDRLLRDTIFRPDIAEVLQSLQQSVREAWTSARTATYLPASAVEGRLASLQLALVERDRDRFLAGQGLFDALFVAAEGYLRDVPLVSGSRLKALLREREVVRCQLVRILPPLEEAAASAA